MKTLTALMLALASLSTAQARELETSEMMVVSLPIPEEMTPALTDEPMPTEGECKAVCMLPMAFD